MIDMPFKKDRVFTVTRRVTEEIYRAFVTCSGDVNPLHSDDAYAKGQGYPGKLMHGAILNAFISGFVGMSLPSSDTMCLMQKVNFKRPFFLDEMVTLYATVESVQGAPQPQKWITSFKLLFKVDVKIIATGSVDVLVGVRDSKED